MLNEGPADQAGPSCFMSARAEMGRCRACALGCTLVQWGCELRSSCWVWWFCQRSYSPWRSRQPTPAPWRPVLTAGRRIPPRQRAPTLKGRRSSPGWPSGRRSTPVEPARSVTQTAPNASELTACPLTSWSERQRSSRSPR